ncbi:spore germination protein [Paenibacillus sp. URB8-2]|uniref:spore germination protein n=1 Tax=Paenibacillus sp. URB8-2 TaxID=2741301 RepID=UPI0015BCD9C9|nr:spore germination protein [Paenibacillus sp. URB8-2]BCG60169.1 spore germination protein KA [Paenibacillus sp. URB8-2]
MSIWRTKPIKPAAVNSGNRKNAPLSSSLDENLKRVRDGFGNSPDLIIRNFKLMHSQVRVGTVYIEGITDKAEIEDFVGHAMSFETSGSGYPSEPDSMEIYNYMKEKALGMGKEKAIRDMDGLFEALLSGNTVILIDGLNQAIGGAASGGKVRAVSEAATQISIRGSKEAFTESIGTNIAAVRRRIKNPDLWVEALTLGSVTQTEVAIMYIHGIADEKMIQELRSKLNNIHVDSILESGYIEQLIEENKNSPFPTLYNTERPDSVAGNLLEGRIAVFVDGTPFVLIAPTTFFMFFHTVEDYYQRYGVSSLIRMLRLLCLFISLFGPGLFVAALNFHQEMIPTPLLISLASQREGVPFPIFVEALLMEVTFEIIREAGIRMPAPIGQTVSIIGGLVLGEAAVQAGIVSSAMVIIVSLTGISSFATPAYNMALSIRLLRFINMFAAAFMGLYGIAITSLIVTAHLCSLRSLGTPYMSPIAPFIPEAQKDTLVRSPMNFLNKTGGEGRSNEPGGGQA